MPIATECPYCSASYRLADNAEGKKVVCRHCNKAFIVRAVRGTAPAPEAIERPSANPQLRSRQPQPAMQRRPGRKTQQEADEDAAPAEGSNRVLWIAAGAAGVFVLLLAAVVATWAIATRGSAPPQAARNNAPAEAVVNGGRVDDVAQAAPPLEASNAAETKPSPPFPRLATPSDAPDSSRRTGADGVASVGQEAVAGSGGKVSASVLQQLKEATVFIKREAGRLSATGSGFVMKLDGETAYIVTNHHVIDPTGERLSISRSGRIQVVKVRASSAVILAVFRSGTKEERALNAEVVASDSSRDLAVLKVNGVRDFARAIDLERKAGLMETMPVYILGFPFGQSLSLKKGNPNITINKGSISSLRENDQGQMKAVQIDGALNPGNSGGPVVDEQGRLVGVAVATIEGAGIGLAIAPEELTRMLQGRVGGISFTKRLADQTVTLDLEAQLIDPMGQMKSVFLHYARSNPTREKPRMDREGRFPPLSEAQDLPLKMDNQRATGTLQLAVADSAGYDIDYQMAYVNGAGTLIYTAPGSYHVDARIATPVPPVANRPYLPPGMGIPKMSGPPPTVSASGEALWPNAGTVGDLDIKEIPLDVERFPPCLCWTSNAQSFYVLSPSGVIRRISLKDLEPAQTGDLGRPCSWLTMSASGPIVTVNSSQEAWLLNLQLKALKKFPIAGAGQVVSAPTLSVAIACGPDGTTVLDLKRPSNTMRYPGGQFGSYHATVSPDGKYLFAQGGIEQLMSARINGTKLFHDQSSPRIATNGQSIAVSSDSKYVCLPAGGGNSGAGNYGTFIFPVTNLNRPLLAIESGAYPRAVGFDPKAGLIYVQNHSNQLIVCDPSGNKLKQFNLGPSGETKQFLVHPEGRKLVVLTDRKLYYVQVRAGD